VWAVARRFLFIFLPFCTVAATGIPEEERRIAMHIHLDYPTLATSDGYTIHSADAESMPLHDMLYTHHIGVSPARAKKPRPARTPRSKATKRTDSQPRRKAA
jgi:hypothetical protein